MGRRGRGAGNPAVGTSGIFLEFKSHEPTRSAKPSTSSTCTSNKKLEVQPSISSIRSSSPQFFLEIENSLENINEDSIEKESVDTIIESYVKYSKKRAILLGGNSSTNYEEFEKILQSKKLDSSLKKCSAFVKRFKNYSSSQQQVIEKDIETLNLSKYLSEICLAIAETPLKEMSGVSDILTICSKLHQKYRDFSDLLAEVYSNKFLARKIDAHNYDLSGIECDIRVLSELSICGILKDHGLQILISCLSSLCSHKNIDESSKTILSFLREYGFELCGILPFPLKKYCERYQISEPASDLVDPLKKIKIKGMLKTFMGKIKDKLESKHNELVNSENICLSQLKSKGEISPDRQLIHDDLLSEFDNFLNLVKKLAFYLEFQLPDLKKCGPIVDLAVFHQQSDEEEVNENVLSYFDDEDSRMFYENLPDLTKYLTSMAKRENAILLEIEEKEIKEAEAMLDVELEIAELEAGENLTDLTESEDLEPELEASEHHSLANDKTDEPVPPKYNEYLQSLKNCVNSNMIDEAAETFLKNFNSKSYKKKLIKHLCSLSRQRIDLVPLWSRLIAVLKPTFPELGTELVAFLNHEIRFFLRQKHQIFIESKLLVTKYIAELVKFGVFPPHEGFKCLRILLVDFVHHQIDMACAFIESCGRYLYKNPSTKRRMKLYLELMMRKRKKLHLERKYVDMIDMAYLSVFPPSEGETKRNVVPLIDAFLIDIVYFSLNRQNLDDTIEIMKSFEWDSEHFILKVINIFSKPWNIILSRYSVVCSLLAGISEYEPLVGVSVSENILSLILESLNSFTILNNQRLVSLLSYFVEIYCYKLATEECIIQLCYILISHGISYDKESFSSLDPPNSTFRLRLVNIILRGAGSYLIESNEFRDKFKYFIKYLQRYYWFKLENGKWEEGNNIYGTDSFQLTKDLILHLFPDIKIYKSYEEACEKIEKIEGKLLVKYALELPKIESNDALEDTTHYKLPSIKEFEEEADPSNVWTQEKMINALSHHEAETNELESEEPDLLQVTTVEEMRDFDRDLERLMSDSANSSTQRSANFDIQIPMSIRNRYADVTKGDGVISVAVLLKKGNKANVKHVDFPEDVEFIRKMRKREAAEREERAYLKKLTLGINKIQIDEEMQEEKAKLKMTLSAAKSNINTLTYGLNNN